jgi:hypothetical protein
MTEWPKGLRLLGQGLAYLAIALTLGYFSNRPAHEYFPENMAMIKLALAHGGDIKEPCHRRTAAELAELAPNMRRPTECERERLPLLVELELDGQLLYRASLPPTGLAKDGPSWAYESFAVTPGRHELVARMRDSHAEGFDYERRAEIELVARQNLAIDFRAETGGFIFR